MRTRIGCLKSYSTYLRLRAGRNRRHRLRDDLRHAGVELQHGGCGRQCRVRHRGVAFGAGMHGAAIHRRQNAPGRVMDVGRLLRRRQALRIGHGREIAVIGVADPARARQIGAVFAGAAAANHRLAGGVDEIGIEAFAGGRKALPIEFRIGLRTRAEAVIGKCCLMRVDKGHAVGARIAAQDAGLAQRERFQLRQEFVLDEVRDRGEPLRLGVERGMDIEAGASAGAGRAAGSTASGWRRTYRPLATCRRPAASAPRAAWQNPCGRSRVSAPRASSTDAITPDAPEQRALGRRVHDHVGDQSGKIDVVGADRQQHQIELAVGLTAFGGSDCFAQFRELAVDGALAGLRTISTAGIRGRAANRTVRRR